MGKSEEIKIQSFLQLEFRSYFLGYRWVLVSFADMEKIPKDAVKAGNDSDQSKMYVGRVIHEGNQLTVKVLKNHSGGYFSYKGQEIFVELFEVNFIKRGYEM